MQIICKVKFKDFSVPQGTANPYSTSMHPGKDKGIGQYLEYISDGARTAEKEMDRSTAITRESSGDLPADTSLASDMARYQRYMEFREGSEILFGSEGHDVEALKQDLLDCESRHAGGAYIPILSMKESDAILAGADSQQKWMENTAAFVDKFADTVGIPRESVRYIAAFHLKDDKHQNKDADAGKQPHVHLVIWDAEQRHKKLALSKSQFDTVVSLADDIWCGDYYRTHYQERNETRSAITSGFLDTALGQMKDRIHTLISDIAVTTNSSGRLTQHALRENLAMLVQIRGKQINGSELTSGEQGLLKKYHITSPERLEMKIACLDGINRDLDIIVSDVLASNEMRPLLERWREISLDIKSGKGEQGAIKSLYEDEEKLASQLKNQILKYALDAVPQDLKSFRVPSEEKQMKLLSKLNHARFKDWLSEQKAGAAVEIMANLMHMYRIPVNVAIDRLNALLARSDTTLTQSQVREIVEREYAQPPVNTSTSYDIGQALSSMGYDREEGGILQHNLYSYYEWRAMDIATLGYIRMTAFDITYTDIIQSHQNYEVEYEQMLDRIAKERLSNIAESSHTEDETTQYVIE